MLYLLRRCHYDKYVCLEWRVVKNVGGIIGMLLLWLILSPLLLAAQVVPSLQLSITCEPWASKPDKRLHFYLTAIHFLLLSAELRGLRAKVLEREWNRRVRLDVVVLVVALAHCGSRFSYFSVRALLLRVVRGRKKTVVWLCTFLITTRLTCIRLNPPIRAHKRDLLKPMN